jgi:hypothetical protein
MAMPRFTVCETCYGVSTAVLEMTKADACPRPTTGVRDARDQAGRDALRVYVGLYPIAGLEKQLLNLFGIWCKVVGMYCEVTIGNDPMILGLQRCVRPTWARTSWPPPQRI